MGPTRRYRGRQTLDWIVRDMAAVMYMYHLYHNLLGGVINLNVNRPFNLLSLVIITGTAGYTGGLVILAQSR